MLEDKKFSVVVPTLWKYAPFIDFLPQLVDNPIIEQIIIINNDNDAIPWRSTILSHPKIEVVTFPWNTKVNPGWNLGVWMSRCNNVCILSDDIEFDTKIFDMVAEKLQPNMLIVNAVDLDPSMDKEVTILPYKEDMSLLHFGSLMFVRKEDWLDIPAGLNLFYGDYWIWQTMEARFNNNHVISNLYFRTPGSVTVNTFADKELIGRVETQFWVNAMDQFKRNYLGLLKK